MHKWVQIEIYLCYHSLSESYHIGTAEMQANESAWANENSQWAADPGPQARDYPVAPLRKSAASTGKRAYIRSWFQKPQENTQPGEETATNPEPKTVVDTMWGAWKKETKAGDSRKERHRKRSCNCVSCELTGLGTPGRRVVVLGGLLPEVSVSSILSQVCGGPLEKAVYIELKMNPLLELHFLSPDLARAFMDYSKTGIFVVNGERLRTAWRISLERYGDIYRLPSADVVDRVLNHLASRVLTLSKAVPTKTASRSKFVKGFPCPKVNFSSEFDFSAILYDFGSVGEIVEATPMLSANLSLSLHFTDIASAIEAMRLLKEQSFLHTKYAGWTVKYAKDPTARPCFEI